MARKFLNLANIPVSSIKGSSDGRVPNSVSFSSEWEVAVTRFFLLISFTVSIQLVFPASGKDTAMVVRLRLQLVSIQLIFPASGKDSCLRPETGAATLWFPFN